MSEAATQRTGRPPGAADRGNSPRARNEDRQPPADPPTEVAAHPPTPGASAAIAAQPAPEAASTGFHCRTVEETLEALASTSSGLSTAEAEKRREHYGPNRLAAAERTSALIRFLRQFDNMLIYVLLAAALVTALLGLAADTTVILLVVLANGLIGYIQEGRAEDALEAIRGMIARVPRCCATAVA